MEDDLLDEKDYQKILEEKFKNQNVKFISADIKKFSENVEGFMGEHYDLTITYKLEEEEENTKFFIKTKPRQSEYQYQASTAIYIKEIYLYQKLFKEFEKLGYNTTFAPKCYYIKDDETLVLEHLLENNYKLFNRTDFFDEDHCKAALKALAYFHANTIAYEEEKSKILGRKYTTNEENEEAFIPVFFTTKDGRGKQIIDSGIECCLQILKLMEKSEEWKEEVKKKLKNVDCVKIFNTELPFRKTCTHGDLWSNNMLFRYEEGIPILCTLVDYQLLRHSHFGYDIILLLHSNTKREFRLKYKNSLLKYYYNCFGSILRSHGIIPEEVLTNEDFLRSVEHFEPVALTQAICLRTITSLPQDYMNASVESKDAFVKLMFSKDRAKIAAEAFMKDEKFRSIINDIFLDIYDHL